MESKKQLVGAIIQVRANSSRLPGKVLKKIPIDNGRTCIEIIHEQLKRSCLIQDTVFATSMSSTDDAIITECDRIKANHFRGDLDNVLSRFYEIQSQKSFDHIVRLTGDNIFIDAILIDEVLQDHIDKKAKYTLSKGLPIGMNIEIFSGKTIDYLYENSSDTYDLEHVNGLIHRGKSNIAINEYVFTSPIDQARLTIDYPSDYAMANLIFQLHGNKNMIYSQLCELIQVHPWILEINHKEVQNSLPPSLKE